MATPGIRITFNKEIGLYTAEQSWHGGLVGSFGATREEALERLELAKTLCDGCEECRRLRAKDRIHMNTGDC